MLVLSRKPGEDIVIDGRITIRVIGIEGNRARIAIDAPRDIPVHRGELLQRLIGSGTMAASHVRKRKQKQSDKPSTPRVRSLYRRRKEALVKKLGGKCKHCETTESLTFDHLYERDWEPNSVHATKRLRIYEEEAEAGLIQLLCGSCNSKKGKPDPREPGDDESPGESAEAAYDLTDPTEEIPF